MPKETSTMYGRVHSTGPIISIDRENKKPFRKRIIGVESEDQQLVFFESRNNLDAPLKIGTEIEVEYYFAGSIKGDKQYNNIIAANIYVTNE